MFYVHRDESHGILIWILRYVLGGKKCFSTCINGFFKHGKAYVLQLCLSFDLLVLVVPLKLIGVTQP